MVARRRPSDPETLSSASPPDARPDRAPEGAPGATRLGRYELLFELSRGGMGTVHAARLLGAHGFDRVVAIKRLRSEDVQVEPFLAEARVGARITHPNVVQTLELGVDERGAPFIVMQLIEGPSLSQLTRELERAGELLDVDLAAWIVAQAAAGLHAAHELETSDGRKAALVHRDVSPQNLLLSFDGRVYVTDFGIAKSSVGEGQTDSGTIKGKFAYMSPEQSRGAALDRRSDVFALGVVLYELLTSSRLFAGQNPTDTLLRVVSHEPDSPTALRPDLPDELAAITMKCIQKRVGDRFATMAELGDALRGYLRHRAAAVDEHALAALLQRLCGAQKEELRRRLRSYGGAAAPPARASQEEVVISRLDHPPVVSTQGLTRGSKRWALAAGSAFAFLAVLGILFAASAFRARRAPAPASAASATTIAPEKPAPSAEAVSPPTAPAAPAAPPETAAALAVTTAPTHAPRRGARPGRGRPDAGTPTGSSPAPPPSAPFRTLGD
jgi:serine/threonine-protein kinase